MEYVSVMEPSHPVVAVHKGWLRASRAGDHEYGTETPTADLSSNTGPNETLTNLGARRFEFVNSSTGKRKRDPDAARLIRVHVRRNRVLDTTHKRNPPRGRRNNGPNLVRSQASDAISMKESFDPELRLRCQHGVYDTWQFSGSSTALCTWEYPINMLPRMHRLLETYLTYATSRMYPWHLLLRSNPLISSAWFRYAVTDAGMLHAMLYSGALYLALLEGKTETKETIYHLNQTISIINKHLSISPHFVQDSTIGAITCLALGSAVAGNQSVWRIHMRGLKEIVEKRGSLSSFDGILQAKIRRSDITGAIDYGAIPCLQLERSNRLSIWSKLPEQTLQAISSDVTRILTNCDIHADLITIMVALANFTQAMGSAIHDPEWEFDLSMCAEDMYWIEYRLLAFPAAHPNSYREKDVNKACRLGALIYIKATLEEFPHSKMGSSFLLEELRVVLHNLPIEESRLPLLLWLSLIGAAISKSPRDRERFVSYLAKLVANSSSSTFRDRELDLTRVLGTRLVLGSPVDRVWESVTGVANTNIR